MLKYYLLIKFSAFSIQQSEAPDKMKLFKYDKATVTDALKMSVPSVIESFFVAFAGLVDSLMVSSLGPAAVAAVGLTTQPKFIGLAVFFAINVAISALVARRFGEKKRDDANRILLSSVAMIVVLTIVSSILFTVFASQIITWCGSTAETHDDAVAYYQIIMGGMLFNCLQMGINAAQRGAGNTKITMRTNITSNTINIILNSLLINGNLGFPALGVRGAAIATVLGTVVSSIMSIASIMKADSFISLRYIYEKKIKPSLKTVKNIIKLGYSVFFEQLLLRVGLILTAVMAAHQGTYAMAAHQVGMNIMSLSFSVGDGLQAAAVALIGKSLGENNPQLAKQYGSACQMLGGIGALFLAIVYFFGAGILMRMFFSEPEIVDIGIGIMHIIIVVVFFQVRQVIYMGCLRGGGDTLYTAVASAISVTIIRTLFSYGCCYTLNMGITGIWLGVLADQVSRFMFAGIRFKTGKWLSIRI